MTVIQSVTWLAGRDPAGASSPAPYLHGTGSRPRFGLPKTAAAFVGPNTEAPDYIRRWLFAVRSDLRTFSASSPDWPNSQALSLCGLSGLSWLSSSHPAFRWRPGGRSAGIRSWSQLRRDPFRGSRLPTRARLNGASTHRVRPRPRSPSAGFQPASVHHGPLRTFWGCSAGLSPSPVLAVAHRVEQKDFTAVLLESPEPPSSRTSPSPGIRLYPVNHRR